MGFQETVFSQLVKLVDHNEFRRCVARYSGDYRSRSFRCWDQFLCMLFAQWGEKESLRSTCFVLERMSGKLYHMGIRGRVSLSALSGANQTRDWRIWRDYANSLKGFFIKKSGTRWVKILQQPFTPSIQAQ